MSQCSSRKLYSVPKAWQFNGLQGYWLQCHCSCHNIIVKLLNSACRVMVCITLFGNLESPRAVVNSSVPEAKPSVESVNRRIVKCLYYTIRLFTLEVFTLGFVSDTDEFTTALEL